mgnify:FL=1
MSKSKPALKSAFDRIVRLSTGLRRPPSNVSPQKILIMQPCCLGQVMQTTPLLAALSEGFPEARIDWAVSDWAMPAIGVNPRLTRIIHTGAGSPDNCSREELRALIDKLRAGGYDACFVPSQSNKTKQAALQADIPRVFGFNGGRKMKEPTTIERLTARRFLSLATAAGVDPSIIDSVEMEFEPPDVDRAKIARRLVEELDWLGDKPLVILHPGGGDNPDRMALDKRWPAQRFARLANHLTRTYGAHVIVAGTAEERAVAEQVVGMIAFPVTNLAGQLGLGELGALCELADLYVGNDAGSTCVAAATGCPTLAIYGPTDPAVYGPYMVNGRVRTLWKPYEGAFNWAAGVSVTEACAAADELMTEPARLATTIA